MNRPNYRVVAQRDGRFWFVEIPELDLATQALKAADVEAMAREVVALMREVDQRSFDLTVEWQLPAAAQEHFSMAQENRVRAGELTARAAEETKAGARALADSGLSLREIGTVLGLSFQRAHQLVRGRG